MDAQTLRDFRRQRRLPMDAFAVLARKDTSTISRIETGKQQASPETIVHLATALGVSARRMKALCDASWSAGQEAPAKEAG